MILSPRAQQLMALQKLKYLQSLADKRARIAHQWNEIQHDGWTSVLSSSLKTEIHRLSGSAGCFELDDLGQAAQKLDVLMTSDNEIEIPDSEFRRMMDAMFHALDQIIDDLPDN